LLTRQIPAQFCGILSVTEYQGLSQATWHIKSTALAALFRFCPISLLTMPFRNEFSGRHHIFARVPAPLDAIDFALAVVHFIPTAIGFDEFAANMVVGFLMFYEKTADRQKLTVWH